jgi:hypothetical protein
VACLLAALACRHGGCARDGDAVVENRAAVYSIAIEGRVNSFHGRSEDFTGLSETFTSRVEALYSRMNAMESPSIAFVRRLNAIAGLSIAVNG